MLLYSAPLSLFARKVEIALGEKMISYDRILVPFTQTAGYAPKHAAVLAANPKGQVPVLIVGDLALYDSTVIIEYLDEAYPQRPLFPRIPRERARCRLLELEADEVLLVPVRNLMFRTAPPGPDRESSLRQEAEAAKAVVSIEANHRKLDHLLQASDYVCGEFSAADIATFMMVHYGLRLGGPGIADHPRLLRWYRRLAARPAFAQAIAEIAAADLALSHPVAGVQLPEVG